MFEKSLSSTLITSLPKKSRALNIKDFWLISLLGSAYEVLANRLKLAIGIQSQKLNAFVVGKNILDLVLNAHECFACRKHSGKPWVICKLDIEKAYNHVNWNYLIFVGRTWFWQGLEEMDLVLYFNSLVLNLGWMTTQLVSLIVLEAWALLLKGALKG